MGRPDGVPACAGVGLRAPHYRAFLEEPPAVGWLEVHSENYFGAGGLHLAVLTRLREDYPVSLHGVGLSLGSTDPLSRVHLEKLKGLIERLEPGLVSEHLSWSSVDGRHLHDLLPLPYTEEALAHLVRRVEAVQAFLGRAILVENPSSYLRFRHSTLAEEAFLAELASRSGCGILLDVNNLYVSAANHGFDPLGYLQRLPAEAVQEIHLAGFERDGDVLIDTHGKAVYPEVWTLYWHALQRFGARPTLIEWDTDLPALSVLLAEAAKAQAILDKCHEPVA